MWEQQGFGSYNYGRDYKTYGKNARFFAENMTDTEVKINGKLAGNVIQGAFYRFKYNITNKLQFGKVNT